MELIKAKAEDFSLIYSDMEKSFVREEIRDRDAARAGMTNEKYSVYHVTDGGTRVGFMTVWKLSGFLFLEHFVTYEAFRNKGYGTAALKLLKEKSELIILEAEPPIEDMQKRRSGYYKRNGFSENDFPYTQPPYRDGDEGVELVLMSYPKKLSDVDSFVEEIYREVYKINL